MSIQSKRNSRYSLALLLGVGMIFGAAGHDLGAEESPRTLNRAARVTAAQAPDEVVVDLDMPFPDDLERVAELLQWIEENALDIRQSATRLTAFLESPGEYLAGTHRWRLNVAEARFVELKAAIERLNPRAAMLLEGQREALGHMRPAVSDLEIHIKEASDLLDATQGKFDPDYAQRIREITDDAATIVDAARLAESIGEVRLYLEALDR